MADFTIIHVPSEGQLIRSQRLSRRAQELINVCDQIKAGNAALQERLMNVHGFRQWTREEIVIVNKLLKGEYGDDLVVPEGLWAHVPVETYHYTEMHPADVNRIRHLKWSYYLVNLTTDGGGYEKTWVMRQNGSDLKPLFDASPWIKEKGDE